MSNKIKDSIDFAKEIQTSKRAINVARNSDAVKIQSTFDKALKESQNISQNTLNKRKKIAIIIISISALLIITAIILIVGHFKLGWFMKKNDLVLVQNREVNLVSRYLEKKYSSNYYDLEGLDQNKSIQNNTVLTDFVVGVNKKTKINSFFDLSEPDYLYESFLLIINLTETNDTNSEHLGGINILDKSKTAEDLIQINDEFL